jgi:DNA-binding response OmpR family regulator
MHILLIEPDKILAETYYRTLQAAGHTVTVVHSAQSGISGADRQKPDVVILELQLVEHSGIEFLYEFRSYDDWRMVPVLILSQVPAAEFNTSWQLLEQELGVSRYLYKSQTTLRQLLSVVSDLQLQAA